MFAHIRNSLLISVILLQISILILGTVEGSSSYFGELQISVFRITDICNSIMDISKRISDIFNSITDIWNSLNYGYL